LTSPAVRFALTAALLTFAALAPSASARLLRIPEDFQNLRTALTEARANDTVMLASNRYTGADNFNLTVPANVTVMSARGPLQCIIDGQFNENGSRGFIMSTGSKLIGLTITGMNQQCILDSLANNVLISNCILLDNRTALDIPVGLKIFNSTGVRVEHCLFQQNHSRGNGGALFNQASGGSSTVTVFNCIFDQNTSQRNGGAMFTNSSGAESDVFNCLFMGNTTNARNDNAGDGGAMSFSQTARGTVRFCTFINNTGRRDGAESWGGGLYLGSQVQVNVINSIFWGNAANVGAQLVGQSNGQCTMSYCAVEGGWQNNRIGTITVGQGNIEDNPEFVEGREPERGPQRGWNFFYLNQEDSPCVDAGSGQADALGVDTMFTDPGFQNDAGVADIGFHFSTSLFRRIGTITGFVRDLASGRGIAAATVTTSRYRTVLTDNRGAFLIIEHPIGQYWIRFSAPGFLDSLETGHDLTEDATDEYNVQLLHPEFTPSRNSVDETIFIGDSVEVGFTLQNTGNGPLEWQAQTRLTGAADRDPWTFRASINAGQRIPDDRLQGVVLADSFYYVAGKAGRDSMHLIYKINLAGNLVDSIYQPGNSVNGMVDITWDPVFSLIWGSQGRRVYGFNLQGEVLFEWDTPFNPVGAIAFDVLSEVIYVTGSTSTSHLFAYDREGNQILGVRSRGMRVYGLSYWPGPENRGLYLMHRPATPPALIYRYDPIVGDSDTVRIAPLPLEGGDYLGAWISGGLDIYSVVFFTVANIPRNSGSDRIDQWQFAANTSWMILDPSRGSLDPEDTQVFSLWLKPRNFPSGMHRGQIIFTHNAEGEMFDIPINLRLEVNAVPGERKIVSPEQFGFAGASPNPFNNSTTLSYRLDQPGRTSLAIYDLAGREVARLLDDFQLAGSHSLTLTASNWPSGVYLARLESNGLKSVMKVALLK